MAITTPTTASTPTFNAAAAFLNAPRLRTPLRSASTACDAKLSACSGA